VAVEHEARFAREHEAVAAPARDGVTPSAPKRSPAASVATARPSAIAAATRAPPRIAGREQRRRGHAHARQERRAEQRLAHLFEQRRQLHEPEPGPPCSSGIATPVQPSSVAMRFQVSASQPRSLAIAARTCSEEE